MSTEIELGDANERAPERVGRPFLVTMLALLVLTMAGANLIRFATALSQWSFLSNLPRVSPIYLAVSGLVWFLAGLPLTWGLWRGHPAAPKAARIIALLYASYFWIDRIFVESAGDNLVNWPFMLGLTIILLAFTFWVLARPKSKAYFGEIHD